MPPTVESVVLKLKLASVVPAKKSSPTILIWSPPMYDPVTGETLSIYAADTTATGIISMIRRRKHIRKERVPGLPFNPFALQSFVISDFLIVIKQPF
jgi:hypothetical protein